MTKYLKHINPSIATYSSGRTDFLTVSATPGTVLLYSDIINEDDTSKDYNAHLWNDYVTKGHWTIINVNEIIWNNFIVSFAPASSSSFISGGGGAAAWPITGTNGAFTFVQGSYIIGTGDQFIVTQTGPNIVNDTLPLNVQSNQNAGATADYNCTIVIGGTTLSAVLTIEYYVPQGF